MSDLTDKEFWSKQWSFTSFLNSFWLIYNREAEIIIRRVLMLIPRNGSLLELGGAPGRMAVRIFKIRPDLTIDCIDFSEDGVLKAKELYEIYNIKGKIILSDFRDYKKGKKSYDFVCSYGLIEHFDNPSDIINMHFEFVKKGGKVFFTIPNYSPTFVKKMLIMFSHETVKTHNFSCMDPEVLRKCVLDAGGIMIESGSFGGAQFPHRNVNNNLGGLIYKLYAQGWNLFTSILTILSCGWFVVRFWDSQIYIMAKKGNI